jgi:hypothetical protein
MVPAGIWGNAATLKATTKARAATKFDRRETGAERASWERERIKGLLLRTLQDWPRAIDSGVPASLNPTPF